MGTGSQSHDTVPRSEPRWEGWRTELCWLGHWQLMGPDRGRRKGGESQGAMSEHAEKAERGGENKSLRQHPRRDISWVGPSVLTVHSGDTGSSPRNFVLTKPCDIGAD